jgi:hypothetical protein
MLRSKQEEHREHLSTSKGPVRPEGRAWQRVCNLLSGLWRRPGRIALLCDNVQRVFLFLRSYWGLGDRSPGQSAQAARQARGILASSKSDGAGCGGHV